MILNYKNEIIHIEVVRSKRTTLCISIRDDEKVLVKAPLFLNEDKIREILEKKAEWILEKKKEVHKVQEKKISRNYENGSTLPYLGREYPMEIVIGKKASVSFEEEKFVIVLSEKKQDAESLKGLLKKWYKKQTLDMTTKRAADYARQMNVSVTSISIKSRKKQWGTCDNKGNLTFNWRLSMASPEAMDYVVVHELCHRQYMDHSKQFWGQVKQILPDYKRCQTWLEENSINMNL